MIARIHQTLQRFAQSHTVMELVVSAALLIYGEWLLSEGMLAGAFSLIGAVALTSELIWRKPSLLLPIIAAISFGAAYTLAPRQQGVMLGLYYTGAVAVSVRRSQRASVAVAHLLYVSFAYATFAHALGARTAVPLADLLLNYLGLNVTAIATQSMAFNARIARQRGEALQKSLEEQREISARLHAVGLELAGRIAGSEELAAVAARLAGEQDPSRIAEIIAQMAAHRYRAEAVALCSIGAAAAVDVLAIHRGRCPLQDWHVAAILSGETLADLRRGASVQIAPSIDRPSTVPSELLECGAQVLTLVAGRITTDRVYVLLLVHDDAHRYEPWEIDLMQAHVRLAGGTIDVRLASAAMDTANRQREQYMALVAHEIRAPLAVVENVLEILATQSGELSAREYANLVGAGRRTATRLHTLMDNLLSAENIQSGRLVIKPRPTLLMPILAEAADAVAPLLEGRDQRLDFDVADERLVVRAHNRYVVQALVNLLSNASTYGPAGEPVCVRVDTANGFARITVEDRGPGIPVDERGNVFTRFFRGSNSLQLPGAGLGLAIVKSTIEAHGGNVGLDTETRRGTHFWITLPLADAAA